MCEWSMYVCVSGSVYVCVSGSVYECGNIHAWMPVVIWSGVCMCVSMCCMNVVVLEYTCKSVKNYKCMNVQVYIHIHIYIYIYIYIYI